MLPPPSRLGPATDAERAALIKNSIVAGVYEETVDPESAYEKLQARTQAAQVDEAEAKKADEGGGLLDSIGDLFGGSKKSSRSDSVVEAMAKSAMRSVGSNLGREIVRGVLGSLFGSSTKRR